MIKLGRYKEFFEEYAPELAERFPSITDSFADKRPDNYDLIRSYIVNGGETKAATTANAVDIFTGEDTGFRDMTRSDGTYSWPVDLAYYMEKYNYCPPVDFLAHVSRQQ